MPTVLVGCSSQLPILITTIIGRWVPGKGDCVLTAFMGFNSTFVRTSLMFVFVVDRFLSVLFPYFYPRHKVKIAVSLSVFSWLIVFIVSVINLPGILDCYTYIAFSTFATIPALAVDLVLFLAMFTLPHLLFLPLLFLSFSLVFSTVKAE